MRYWAYIDSKVCGPFEKEKLAEISNFSLSSLLCPDTPGGGQASNWKAASAYPEVVAVFGPAPAPAQPGKPAADSPLMMTMRGTLIDEPVIDTPAAKPPESGSGTSPSPAKARKPAAESPLLMTMRGTLIDEPAKAGGVTPGISGTNKEMSGAGIPDRNRPIAEKPVSREQDAQLEPLKHKLDQMSAMLVSIADNQSQLLTRLNRVEGVVLGMKSLLFPGLPKKD